jgi:hypothetical protein
MDKSTKASSPTLPRSALNKSAGTPEPEGMFHLSNFHLSNNGETFRLSRFSALQLSFLGQHRPFRSNNCGASH